MSDEEDIEDNEEEEEEEEGDEDEEEEEAEEGDDEGEALAKLKEKKQKSIQEDIATIKDIFQYIDRCSVRMVQEMQMAETIQSFQGNQRSPQQQSLGAGGGIGNNNNQQIPWSNYEHLNDGERAELLERALLTLAGDDFR